MRSTSTGLARRDAVGCAAAASPSNSSSSVPFCVFRLQKVQFRLPDGRPLWQEPLSLNVVGRERLGIVGRNGVGKSVLARLLAGRMLPSSGLAERSGRMHWLVTPSADGAGGASGNVAEAMGLGDLFAAVSRLEAGLATTDDLVLAEGQWDLPLRMAQALSAAGLSGLSPAASLSTLSGGERMRAALAGVMAAGADGVVLDEPSNHLDADARRWLMRWLEATRKTVVMVSHDRQLLHAVDRIAELSPRGLAVYGGGYALYRLQRDEEAATAQSHLDRACQERDQALAKLRREHDDRQRRLAQARQQARHSNLAPMVINTMREHSEATSARQTHRHADRRAALDHAVRAAAQRVDQTPPISLALPESNVLAGKPVLRLDSLQLRHLDHAAIDTILTGPARVALTGPNGCGKSSLLRTIAGISAPYSGRVHALVSTAMLDQDGSDSLPPNVTLLEHLRSLNCPLPDSMLRTRLAQLRLGAGRVALPMGLLSAGERLKAALACALWRAEPARLLLLDEPTNHLDLDSTLELQEALLGYKGALIVASHDPSFIESLNATHLWRWCDGCLEIQQAQSAIGD